MSDARKTQTPMSDLFASAVHRFGTVWADLVVGSGAALVLATVPVALVWATGGTRPETILVAFFAYAIAYFCLTDLGAPQVPLRAAVHGFFGATAFTVVAVKLALIRFRPQLAYNVAPWLGRYVAFAFLMIWVTSALAYFTHNL